MKDYRARIIEEKIILGDKITKLDSFILHDYRFSNLSLKEQHRMKKQLSVMMEYYDILGERIEVIDNPELDDAENDTLFDKLQKWWWT